MVTIVGISGSLRKHSFNAGLLRAAADAVPEGCMLTIESIKGIPLYDGDVEETEGIPAVVVDLKVTLILEEVHLIDHASIPDVVLSILYPTIDSASLHNPCIES